jgi:acyl-CoA thioesterase-1
MTSLSSLFTERPRAAIPSDRQYGARPRPINALAALCLLFSLLLAAPAAGAEKTILALGDSLVAGYGLEKADSFPTELEEALRAEGHDVRVINAGVSGDTSKGGLARVDWLFADKPDLMLLELGANDGLRGLPPAQTEENLAAIIEKAQDAGVPVLLAGMMAPPNLGREYGEEFNAVFPRLAERYDVAFYPFFLDGVAAEPELNQGDGMHPNAAGVDVIVERILPHVIDALPGTDSGESS